MSIVIVGAGPNLGLAIGRRFGSEGLSVGLVSRDQANSTGSSSSSRPTAFRPRLSPPTSASQTRSRRRSAPWRIGSARSRSSSTRRCPRASS